LNDYLLSSLLPRCQVTRLLVLVAAGLELLPKGSFGDTVLTMVTMPAGIAALAGGVQNWPMKQTSRAERPMPLTAGLHLAYPGPLADGVGLTLVIAAVAMQRLHVS
jgi:TRAP-type uncharacterized transport system fused permease subunit